MRKTIRTVALVLLLALMLSACSAEPVSVPVEQVYMLLTAGNAAEKFAGVVVSENAVQIGRELDKTIKDLYVEEGQEIQADQKLFSYDTEELSLTLDRQELDLERLNAEIDEKKTQIADVEKELKKATGDTKTQLNIQLRQLQTELTQATYDKSAKQREIEYTKKMLQDVDVRSPISGTIRLIDETSTDAYIVIQQSGAYQVKGLLNELSLNAGITVGSAVTVISRIDSKQVWTGVVSSVDYNNTESNAYDSMYGYAMDGSGLTNSTSYPFYITLDSTDGLLLGQHVYIQLTADMNDDDQLWLPESYLMEVSQDENLNTVAKVWSVDEENKLVLRQVTLGEYNVITGGYAILDGLTLYDYIADPSNPDCREGAVAQIRDVSDFYGSAEE